jgi:drug/metabolite transporter (DMT)-like permease
MLRAIAISLSLLAAVALAFGAQFQNDSVVKKTDEQKTKVGLRQVLALFTKPRWLTGMSLLVAGAVLQISALTLAPLIVVQPLGGIALVITALLNARVTKTKINRATWIAISLCTFGIAAFVSVASSVASEVKLDDSNLFQILSVLSVIVVIFGVLFFTIGKKAKAISFILGAGVLYGFVASLIKAVVQRIIQGDFSVLTFVCAVITGVAVLLGGWFVQNAYASGPPDLVIAGLTVIDPMVAVCLGIVILGEAQQANPVTLAVFITSAIVAVIGVWTLSKVHPELATEND